MISVFLKKNYNFFVVCYYVAVSIEAIYNLHKNWNAPQVDGKKFLE